MADPKAIFESYYSALLKTARDESMNAKMSRALSAYRQRTSTALDKFPDTQELAKEVRGIKEKSIGQLDDLVELASKSLAQNGAHTYYAKTGDKALEYISKVVGTGKICVFGKSGTAEEIGLRNHLEQLGNECWETDVGEVIVQIRKERPMHSGLPAIHVSREEVAKSLSSFLGREITPDIPTEVAAIRSLLRGKYSKADIGVTGCNVLAADTGSILLIENEGNIHLCTGMPPVHIVLVGIEKIVPTLHAAFKVVEVEWRYAGYTVPAYMSMVSGPSNTADIELAITYGASGPADLHVVFLDNGRSSLAKEPVLGEALYCIKCGGRCLFECPLYQMASGYYGYKYQGGLGAIWTAYLAGGLERAVPIAFTCLRCGRCAEVCPVSIDIPKLIAEFRRAVTSMARGC